MAEQSLADLSYGHFGPTVYDLESKRWIFGRKLGRGRVLRPLGEVRRVVKGTKDIEDDRLLREEAAIRGQRYDRALRREIRRLVQGYPDLQPAEDFLAPLLKASEAVLEAVAKYDPAKGHLLGYGTATIVDFQDRKNKVRLIAMPGGEAGEALRLVRIRTETYGWKKDITRLWVPLPSNEIGWWLGKGAPIQQVCFAEPEVVEDKGTLLAVRLPSSTLIFRPRYRSAPVPPVGVAFGSVYPPSRVDPNMVLEITPRDSQSRPHSDVSFNPWNQYQFAVVDQAGKWAVFNICRDSKYTAVFCFELGPSGMIDEQTERGENGEARDTNYAHDGWARILWAADGSTIVVCTRQQLAIVNLRTGAVSIPPLPIPKEQPFSWYLGISRCPGHPDWLFVLTSTQTFWLEIFGDSDIGDENRSASGLAGKVLLSTRHFRDPDDITLQMNIHDDEGDILVLISSRCNPLVTCLRFYRQEGTASSPAWASDPTYFVLPFSDASPSQFSVAEFFLRRLEYTSEGDDAGSSTEQTPRFYSLELLANDLALHHAFLNSASGNLTLPAPPRLIEGKARVVKSTAKVYDDFVIPDELSQCQRIRNNRLNERPPSQKVTYARHQGESEVDRAAHGPTVQNTKIFQDITRSLPAGDRTILVEDIVDISTDLQNVVLDRQEGLGEPAITLLEHIQCTPQVEELRDASSALEDVFGLSAPGEAPDDPSIVVKRLPFPRWIFSMSIPPNVLSFDDVYAHIIGQQLAPLPQQISARLRVAREKAARSIAAEFMLATARIELEGPAEDSQELPVAEDNSQAQILGQQLTLAYHPSSRKGKERATGPSPLDIPPFPSSQPSSFFPTPSPTGTPSIFSGTSSFASSSSISPSISMRSVISRLSRSAEIKPLDSDWSSRPFALLSHWTPGEDPHIYDYTETLHTIENAEDEEQMTDRQRARARAKAERRLKRQRREAEKAEKLRTVSSSQPMIRSSQQTGPSSYGEPSSQAAVMPSSPQLHPVLSSVRSSPVPPSSPPPYLLTVPVLSVLGSSQVTSAGAGVDSQATDGAPRRKKRKKVGF